MRVGIICGHPIENLFKEQGQVDVDTPYGPVSLLIGTLGVHEILFINRHGKNANIPPQKISYRANIQALSSSHVDCVISIGTVGSMNTHISVGDFVIPHDFFDMTCCRDITFFDTKRVHIDMTNPFCPIIRKHLIATCNRKDSEHVREHGIYVATQGPRLESSAEIRFYATIGDIVGMTLVPEVVLAREKGLCFASLCVVCNMATGMQEKLPMEDIKQIYADKKLLVAEIIRDTIGLLSVQKHCECKERSKDAII